MSLQKKRKDSLFQLVKQLSLPERRLFVRQQGNGDLQPLYLQLLNLIASSSAQDDAGWQEELNLGNVEYRQLKKYLCDKLVGWLSAQQDISPRVDLGRLITEAEVYYLRGLAGEALVAINKARDIAHQYEFFDELVAVLQWQLKISIHQNETELALAILQESDQTLGRLHLLQQYQQLHVRMLALENTIHLPRNEADKARYQDLLNDPLLTNRNAAQGVNGSVRAMLLHNILLSKGMRMLGQYEQSLMHLQQLLALLQQQPSVRLSNPNLVIDCYRNLGLTYQALGLWPQLETFLAQLDGQPFLSSSQNLKLKLLRGRLSISAALAQGQLDRAASLALELETELELYHFDPAFRTDVAYTITEALAMRGQNREALARLTTLINSTMVYGKQVTYEAAIRLMEIVIHAELGHHQFIHNRLRSLRRFILLNPGTSNQEQELLLALMPYAKAVTSGEKKSILHKLQDAIATIPAASLNERHFAYFFDLQAWLNWRLASA